MENWYHCPPARPLQLERIPVLGIVSGVYAPPLPAVLHSVGEQRCCGELGEFRGEGRGELHLGSLLRSGRENVEVCPSLAEVEHPAYHAPHIAVRKGLVVLVVDHSRVDAHPVEDQWHDLDRPAARHVACGRGQHLRDVLLLDEVEEVSFRSN